MARVPIPPVKLPWREKDIKSGDHKLLADYLKILVKTLQKKLEEIGNIININDKYNTGDMLKVDYDPDNDKKVEQADYADNAGHAANADKLHNFGASQTPQADTIPISNNEGKLDEGWFPDTLGSAKDVSYDNASSGLAATNVQDAIDEVDSRVDDIENGATTVGNADKLDNKHGAFYCNASNLLAGTVPRARLDGTYDIDITGNAATANNANKLEGKSGSEYLDKDTYDSNNDGKVDAAEQADNADKLGNFDASQTPQANVIPVSNEEGYLKDWIRLNDIKDVSISTPTNGQVLGYQNGTWRNITIESGSGFEYFVYPEKFGAVGNGVDNDVNAFNQMIDHINSLSSPVIIIFSKPYYIGGGLNTIYFNKPICFRGCGIDVANLIFASGLNGIKLEKKTDNDSPAPCTIEDFTISTRGENTGIAFFARQAKPWNKTKFIAKNVVFAGDNDPGQDGWSEGLYLKDIGDVRVYGCYFYNYYNNQANGIHLEGTASGNYVPTKINITDCNFLYGSKGIFANGHVEGVIVKGCHLVAPDYGFYFTWTNSFIPPHFSFENNHFDIYNTAICLATPVADFYATFNNITGRGEAEPGGRSQNQNNYVRTGIYLSSGTIRARVDNNYFLNGGVSTADIGFNAIVLANGATNNFIGGNTYDNADHDMLAVWEQYSPSANTGNKIMYNINDNFNVYIGSVNPYLKSQP